AGGAVCRLPHALGPLVRARALPEAAGRAEAVDRGVLVVAEGVAHIPATGASVDRARHRVAGRKVAGGRELGEAGHPSPALHVPARGREELRPRLRSDPDDAHGRGPGGAVAVPEPLPGLRTVRGAHGPASGTSAGRRLARVVPAVIPALRLHARPA